MGIHFLEFLRELSVECHKNNLVLSVDNPVPEDFTSHYDRAEQGRVVDYVIIMGYDEHYSGSDAGSVASLPWVEQGIQDTLEEVPADRVINARSFLYKIVENNRWSWLQSEANWHGPGSAGELPRKMWRLTGIRILLRIMEPMRRIIPPIRYGWRMQSLLLPR